MRVRPKQVGLNQKLKEIIYRSQGIRISLALPVSQSSLLDQFWAVGIEFQLYRAKECVLENS